MTARKIHPLFKKVRDYIRRYVVLDDHSLDIVTVWTIGTWTFSPACTNPATYPYLYIAAPKGAGKTTLGQDVLGGITRLHVSTVGITGAGVFRLMGGIDEETGEVISNAPTLAIDEIDATFSGAADEPLRMMLNAGYRRGAFVHRTFGKQTLAFPVFSPKLLMGIENGHLPDTVLDRSIRIELHRATEEEMSTVEPYYSFDVDEEAADLSQEMSDWAKENSLVLREHRPDAIAGFRPRQWEIARTLVQLAHGLGNEHRITAALEDVMTRNPERPDAKVSLYTTIYELFEELHTDRLTTAQILQRLNGDGVKVPSGKYLSGILAEDGIAPDWVRLPKGHPALDDPTVSKSARGYLLHRFDGVFNRYLGEES